MAVPNFSMMMMTLLIQTRHSSERFEMGKYLFIVHFLLGLSFKQEAKFNQMISVIDLPMICSHKVIHNVQY